MKNKLSFFIIITLLIVILTGCQKTNARYYIKYEVDVSSNYSYVETTITVNTDSGEQSFTTGKEFSETFGPVQRNFKAKISAYTNAYQATVNVRIYACRGEESFVLKKTETVDNPKQGNPVEAEYTIDF